MATHERTDPDAFRTIWLAPHDPRVVQVIDQRRLPHEYAVLDLERWQDGRDAIREMAVRGAPLIGATAAFSLYLAALEGGAALVRPAATEQAATPRSPSMEPDPQLTAIASAYGPMALAVLRRSDSRESRTAVTR